jgi:secreted trypsin-like serine protease
MSFVRLLLLFSFFALVACQNQNSSRMTLEKNSNITGGVTSSVSEFPFMANIWQNDPANHFNNHLCGGSLIARHWVLTAAHCIMDDASESTLVTVKASELTVILGSSAFSGTDGRKYAVKAVIPHPQFSWPHHDVALLQLSEDVLNVAPVALSPADKGDLVISASATVIGWGLTDTAGVTDANTLQKVTLPLIKRSACATDPWVRHFNYSISTDMVCAQTSNNSKASCPGDSGGPLLQNDGGHSVQIGIVSWGSACGGSRPSSASSVEGYAAVADAYDWIQSVIK